MNEPFLKALILCKEALETLSSNVLPGGADQRLSCKQCAAIVGYRPGKIPLLPVVRTTTQIVVISFNCFTHHLSIISFRFCFPFKSAGLACCEFMIPGGVIAGHKGFNDFFIGNIGKKTMISNIFHMTSSLHIKRMKHIIVYTVGIERFDLESLAKRYIEYWCNLDPAPFQKEVVIAMIEKNVCLHNLFQTLRRQMIANIREMQTAGNALSPGNGGKDNCFGNTVTISFTKNNAGLKYSSCITHLFSCFQIDKIDWNLFLSETISSVSSSVNKKLGR
jgi:hypothetical protein